MAEVLAIEEALHLAIQHRWRKLGVFSDSKIVIESIIKAQNHF